MRILWTVLSLVLGLAGLPGAARGQGCPLPPEYTHTASASVGDVVVTLAVGQSHYDVGDPLTFRLSLEDTGTTTQVVRNPSLLDPLRLIMLLPARCESLEEAGCYDDGEWLYRYPPGGWFCFGPPLTL